MHIAIDYNGINALLEAAHAEGRSSLYEHEVYSLLSCSGAETPPESLLVSRTGRPSDEQLTGLPGDRVVLKIVSPYIIHKTEVGGVRVVDKRPDRIRPAIRRMFYEIPENYALWIERNREAAPEAYRELAGEALVSAVSSDLHGVLLVQYMEPDSQAFGNELIVGLRNTREFGMILTAGLGGTDTELYAERFRKGQAIVAGSTEMHDGDSFFELFKPTIAYKKLAGLTRGQRRIVTDEQLIECFESFIRMANQYSPVNPDARYILEELEINPFAFSDYLMVPLDGMCRFSLAGGGGERGRPIGKIDALLHPETIGIIGVSSVRRNFGRIILDNILAQGFAREGITIIKDGPQILDGVRCISGLAAVTGRLDLFIVAVGADQVPELVEEVIRRDAAESVMLIPGAMGETEESKERVVRLRAAIDSCRSRQGQGPVFLGANSMGVVSGPGGYDTWFIPEEKLPRRRSGHNRAALISQSGAFMLHRSHQCPELHPAYMIAMGNQTDLTLGDMVEYFKDSLEVDVIAVYAEGFNDLDGLQFCTAVRQAVLSGKEVIFYKAGRTPEGKAATSGHTASLAGDYMVCESSIRQAGAMVARTFTEFQELFFLAVTLGGKKVNGNRLAAVSGAGFEAVGMADSIESDDYHLQLAVFSPATIRRIAGILQNKGLDRLVSIANPLDINPAADDATHAQVAEAVLTDTGVDALVISLDPMSPAMHTLLDSDSGDYDMEDRIGIKNLIIRLAAQSDKPLVTVVDGGRIYDPLRDALMASGVPVFTASDKAVAVLGLYIEGQLARDAFCVAHGTPA